jgi:integrase
MDIENRQAETLLALAAEHEPRFEPLLRFLLSTGARRGEALGLRWENVDFERRRITIRRALTKGIAVTPKSGRARNLAMPPSLAESLFDLLASRRRECISRGWAEVPESVFCSKTGTPLDERNVTRSWDRLRRRAQKHAVRPLRLHDARHTFASLALAAGRSIRWVAEQLGHCNPELTLRVYAHAMPVEEHDLAFADFAPAGQGGPQHTPKRPYAAPALPNDPTNENAPDLTSRGHYENLERETGIEPATLSLGS